MPRPSSACPRRRWSTGTTTTWNGGRRPCRRIPSGPWGSTSWREKKTWAFLRRADRPHPQPGLGGSAQPRQSQRGGLAHPGPEARLVGPLRGGNDGHVGRLRGGGQGGVWAPGPHHHRPLPCDAELPGGPQPGAAATPETVAARGRRSPQWHALAVADQPREPGRNLPPRTRTTPAAVPDLGRLEPATRGLTAALRGPDDPIPRAGRGPVAGVAPSQEAMALGLAGLARFC